MKKRNSRCTTLERWFDLIQYGGNESSKADVVPPLHDTEACSSCQFTLEILLQKAYKVTQEQAQAYHSLISEKANVSVGDEEDNATADDQSDPITLKALYTSIGVACKGKRLRSGLELDVLQNLETISTARQSIHEDIERELQLIRKSEADVSRLSDDLHQILKYSDVAARELNSLGEMVNTLPPGTSTSGDDTAGGRGSVGSTSALCLLFTVCKEDMGMMSLNGMRLAYNPIPRLHLNWAEINVAWTVAASALCCLRNLHNKPLTVALAATPPNRDANAGVGRYPDTAGSADAPEKLWMLTLQPLRNRTFVRMVQFRVPPETTHRTNSRDKDRVGKGEDRADQCDVVYDETVSLSGEQSSPIVSGGSGSGSGGQKAYRRAVYAFAAYLLATARDVGRYDDMPPQLVRLDGQSRFVDDEEVSSAAGPGSIPVAPGVVSGVAPAAASPSASVSASGSGVGSRKKLERGVVLPVSLEEEIVFFIGEALCCLLAAHAK